MTPNDYQELSERTQCSMSKALGRIASMSFKTTEAYHTSQLESVELLHSVIGLTGEVGELAATLEKCYYYGQPLDTVNLKEELGDCLWYVAEMCNALNLSLEDVMESNIAKLKLRYPEKFDQELAKEENRDRDAEREIVGLPTVSKRGEPFDVEGLKRHDYNPECAQQTGQGWAEPLAQASCLTLVPPATTLTEQDIALTDSFGDGVVRQKKLDNSYDRFCSQCHKQPVHYSGIGICPDCAAAMRAERGHAKTQ